MIIFLFPCVLNKKNMEHNVSTYVTPGSITRQKRLSWCQFVTNLWLFCLLNIGQNWAKTLTHLPFGASADHLPWTKYQSRGSWFTNSHDDSCKTLKWINKIISITEQHIKWINVPWNSSQSRLKQPDNLLSFFR